MRLMTGMIDVFLNRRYGSRIEMIRVTMVRRAGRPIPVSRQEVEVSPEAVTPMSSTKYVIVIPDGATDEPFSELDGHDSA